MIAEQYKEEMEKLTKQQSVNFMLLLIVVVHLIMIPRLEIMLQGDKGVLFFGILGLVMALLMAGIIFFFTRHLEFSARIRRLGLPFPELDRRAEPHAAGGKSFLGKFLSSVLVVALLTLGSLGLELGFSSFALLFLFSALAFIGWVFQHIRTKEQAQNDWLLIALTLGWCLVVTFLGAWAMDQEPESFEMMPAAWLFVCFLPIMALGIKLSEARLERMATKGEVRDFLELTHAWLVRDRWKAAEELGRLAEKGKASEVVSGKGVELLVNQLGTYDPEEKECWTALRKLALAGERDHVVRCLLVALESHTPLIPYRAAQLLGSMGDPSVIPYLERLLGRDEEFQVRSTTSETGFSTIKLAPMVKAAVGRLIVLEEMMGPGKLGEPDPLDRELVEPQPF